MRATVSLEPGKRQADGRRPHFRRYTPNMIQREAIPMQELQREQTEQIYRAAVARYIEARRGRIPDFTQEHFSLKGSARLHRHAIGWDLVKAPVNAGASVVTALQNLSAKALEIGGAPQQAAKLKSKALFITTEVSEQIN